MVAAESGLLDDGGSSWRGEVASSRPLAGGADDFAEAEAGAGAGEAKSLVLISFGASVGFGDWIGEMSGLFGLATAATSLTFCILGDFASDPIFDAPCAGTGDPGLLLLGAAAAAVEPVARKLKPKPVLGDAGGLGLCSAAMRDDCRRGGDASLPGIEAVEARSFWLWDWK